MGVAILERQDEDESCRKGREGMCALAEEEDGYCYQCLESGLSAAHTHKADLADAKFPVLIH